MGTIPSSRFIAAAVALSVTLTAVACSQRIRIVEVPEGYVGWVKIRYNEECKDAPSAFSVSTVRVSDKGEGCRRVRMPEGWTWTRYFYVDRDGNRTRRLRSSGWDEAREIWPYSASINGSVETLFVGSEEEFDETKRAPP
jgi:hypothetical protein